MAHLELQLSCLVLTFTSLDSCSQSHGKSEKVQPSPAFQGKARKDYREGSVSLGHYRRECLLHVPSRTAYGWQEQQLSYPKGRMSTLQCVLAGWAPFSLPQTRRSAPVLVSAFGTRADSATSLEHRQPSHSCYTLHSVVLELVLKEHRGGPAMVVSSSSKCIQLLLMFKSKYRSIPLRSPPCT